MIIIYIYIFVVGLLLSRNVLRENDIQKLLESATANILKYHHYQVGRIPFRHLQIQASVQGLVVRTDGRYILVTFQDNAEHTTRGTKSCERKENVTL